MGTLNWIDVRISAILKGWPAFSSEHKWAWRVWLIRNRLRRLGRRGCRGLWRKERLSCFAPVNDNAGHWHSAAAVTVAAQRQAHEASTYVVCVNSEQLAVDFDCVAWADQADVCGVKCVVHSVLSLMGPEPLGVRSACQTAQQLLYVRISCWA